jgi:hypothetical protein
MSLSPLWFSTMFGVYYFAGASSPACRWSRWSTPGHGQGQLRPARQRRALAQRRQADVRRSPASGRTSASPSSC